jgi:hypothetical protein
LSTTNLAWTYLGSNPEFRGDGKATNRLNHGTATNLDSISAYLTKNSLCPL